MQGPGFARFFGFGALLAALLLLLASCSTGGGPLPDSGSGSYPKGKTVPPVSLQQVTGLPPGKLSQLKSALAVAGGQRDIGIVEGKITGSYSLAGQFTIASQPSGVAITYQWQLRDADGVIVATIDGDDNAGVYSGSDPWSVVNSAVIERIARRTTEEMAQKLNQLGFATKLSALTVPPAEYFAMASPESQREVDFETLNGPGMAAAGVDFLVPPGTPTELPKEEIEPSVAMVDPLPDEAVLARTVAAVPETPSMPAGAPETPVAPQVADSIEKTSPGAQPHKAGHVEIRAVAVVGVKGSPGGGDAELTAAMRKTLSQAGWPVVSKPQADALTIVGRVQVAEGGDNQRVSVRWIVKSPDGKTLGDVKQANDVPKGALDGGWGPAAVAVAEGAAMGIFDIVNKFQ